MLYEDLNSDQLAAEFQKIKAQYETMKDLGLTLDMSRGKPGPDQMDISTKIFDLVNDENNFKNETGIDCRNYGGLDGLPELKKLFAEILGVEDSQVIVGGNSSLNMMFDTVAQAMTHGFGDKPWMLQSDVKFLCPVPGYDRHFAICEYFGIKMIPVANTPEGPDMDAVEELIKDPSVKGIWCVPKYSNPEGIIYSDSVVKRIASLKPAAADFRVFWDNAYAVHGLYGNNNTLCNIQKYCLEAGNPNLVIQFTSTSKITFPGAGVAAEAAGPEDVKRIKNRMSFQTIGPNKLNQLRHARMFKTIDDLFAHMEKHAEILRPKFNIVLETLESELSDLASWNKPQGGYFISLTVPDGTAKRVHTLCSEAGLVMTPAGAPFPYGNDPLDNNLRIAPTYPMPDELGVASKLLCIAMKYAVLEKMQF